MKKSVLSYPPMPPWVHGTVVVLAAVLIAASIGGCGKKNPASMLGPDAAKTSAVASDLLKPVSPYHLEGTLGSGALWVIDRPVSWNGDLVVYMPGYCDPSRTPALPDITELRAGLMGRGYAVMTTSYSQTGWAVKEAVTEAHQLRGVFNSRVGTPGRTYLAAECVGALAAGMLVERFPDQYSGALLMSGVLGGAPRNLAYMGDVRVLFDTFYPGILPGRVDMTPPGTDVTAVLAAARHAMDMDPIALHVIDALARMMPEHMDGPELEETILNGLKWQMNEANDLTARSNGHNWYDNHDFVYSGPLPDALVAYVNANVARYTATPDAIAYQQHYGTLTGHLLVPVVTLHNNWDPEVPESNLDCYYDCVNASGDLDHLMQHRVLRYGHENYTMAERLEAFDDLTSWVETGTQPAD